MMQMRRDAHARDSPRAAVETSHVTLCLVALFCVVLRSLAVDCLCSYESQLDLSITLEFGRWSTSKVDCGGVERLEFALRLRHNSKTLQLHNLLSPPKTADFKP